MSRSGGSAGTGALVRLALRRDRVVLPVCIAFFVSMAAVSAAAAESLYPTSALRVQAATSLNRSPSVVALYGRIADPSSVGAMAMFKLSGVYAALVGVVMLLMLVRHTRAEEEHGRLELLGAGVVGRQAPLTAALLVTIAASLVLGLSTALALAVAGLPVAGSIAFGCAWASIGAAFAAVAAVTAQLTRSARVANGLAGVVLGVTYLLRAVGDAAGGHGAGWLVWLSPVGWGQQVRAFAGERWWVLVVPVGFTAATSAGAYALAARRDLGAGLLPDRPGPARAAAGLRSPLALAWRLQRGALLSWAVSFAVLGGVMGAIATSVGDMLDTPQARKIITALGGTSVISDAYLAAVLSIVGLIAAAYGLQAALRLHGEESAGRVEPLLATAVGRTRWACSHLLVALAGTAALLAVAGLSAGVAYALQMHDGGQIGRVLAAALVQLPAAWVLVGVAVAAFGLAPRFVSLGWVTFAAVVTLGEIGPTLKLDQRLIDISPFAHVPRLPAATLTLAPLLWLCAIAAALIAAGLVGFRRRDVG